MRYQTAADLGADLKRLRRDSGSRQGITPALSGSRIADAETVVISPGVTTQIGGPSGIGNSPTAAGTQPAVTLPPRDPSMVLREAAKTPWIWALPWVVVAMRDRGGLGRISGIVACRRGRSKARHPHRPTPAIRRRSLRRHLTSPQPDDHRADANRLPPRRRRGRPQKLAAPPILLAQTRAKPAPSLRAARPPVSRATSRPHRAPTCQAKLSNTHGTLADLRQITATSPSRAPPGSGVLAG